MVHSRAAVALFIAKERARPLESPGPRLSVRSFQVEGEEGTQLLAHIRDIAFGRTVHDLPVEKVSPPAQADRPRPDPPQGQGDAFDVVPIISLEDRPGQAPRGRRSASQAQ